jgi:DNA/RNA-binding domain of Phe-tRNA-synthetase-like protein
MQNLGMKTKLKFLDDPSLAGIRLGVVEASGAQWESLPLTSEVTEAVASFLARGPEAISPARKAAVRDMLRYASYKPAGRAKPSSEYLLQSAQEASFPSVNFPVDAVNLVSLVTGYPISIVDLGKAGFEFLLRRGDEGEKYVFNSGGQEIELKDLLCLCRRSGDAWIPTANPVRDSMATKIFSGATEFTAFIYSPSGPEGKSLESACGMLVELLSRCSNKAEFAIFAS